MLKKKPLLFYLFFIVSLQIVNSGKQDSSAEKIVSIATILSQQQSQKSYIIHLNEAVVIPSA